MSTKARFSQLADAMKSGVTEAAAAPQEGSSATMHKPAAALSAMSEALRDKVSRLEAELGDAQSTNGELQRELAQARTLFARAGSDLEEFFFLDPSQIVDRLPRDRIRGGLGGTEFQELLADIRDNGQNDAITVRRVEGDTFEIAAGRRRLAACRELGTSVLARIRILDDAGMLRIQYSENERRLDISALERARWFAEARERLGGTAKDVAATFGVDPSTFSLYLRLARFPEALLDKLWEPRKLAVLPARRVMEALESDASALERILGALNEFGARSQNDNAPLDGAGQIAVLIEAAEGRSQIRSATRLPVPEKRHVVRDGQRIGTLTRNGGQWVFRFATSIPDAVVQLLTERLAEPVDAMPANGKGNGSKKGS